MERIDVLFKAFEKSAYAKTELSSCTALSRTSEAEQVPGPSRAISYRSLAQHPATKRPCALLLTLARVLRWISSKVIYIFSFLLNAARRGPAAVVMTHVSSCAPTKKAHILWKRAATASDWTSVRQP